MPLLQFTPKGIFCAQGNFYIDPWQPVEHALITHAHSDHARHGSNKYLCHNYTVPILQLRLGVGNYQGVTWGQTIFINGVQISFHPSGHIIGAAQIRVAYKGEIWVCSGDYKVDNDGISGAFEAIPCHHFITESTFGLPIYNWKPQGQLYADMQQWVTNNIAEGYNSVFIAYSLGKAQRVLDAVKNLTPNVYAHGAIYNTQQVLVQHNLSNLNVIKITADTPKTALKNTIIIAPPSTVGTNYLKQMQPYRIAICSGWMQVRGNTRRQNADKGFALSDHCDWQGLLTAIKATKASNIYVTHGFTATLSKYLTEQGLNAVELKTAYGAVDD